MNVNKLIYIYYFLLYDSKVINLYASSYMELKIINSYNFWLYEKKKQNQFIYALFDKRFKTVLKSKNFSVFKNKIMIGKWILKNSFFIFKG